MSSLGPWDWLSNHDSSAIDHDSLILINSLTHPQLESIVVDIELDHGHLLTTSQITHIPKSLNYSLFTLYRSFILHRLIIFRIPWSFTLIISVIMFNNQKLNVETSVNLGIQFVFSLFIYLLFVMFNFWTLKLHCCLWSTCQRLLAMLINVHNFVTIELPSFFLGCLCDHWFLSSNFYSITTHKGSRFKHFCDICTTKGNNLQGQNQSSHCGQNEINYLQLKPWFFSHCVCL
jgi:hypothetical protein